MSENNYEKKKMLIVNLPENDFMLATRRTINHNLLTEIVMSYSSPYKDSIRIYFGEFIEDNEFLEKVKEFLYTVRIEYINIERKSND